MEKPLEPEKSSPPSSMPELDAAKIAARRSLLAQDSQVAQAKVNQILHPDLWTLAEDQSWEDRLPLVRKVFDQTSEPKSAEP
jgi:hypothetical protein